MANNAALARELYAQKVRLDGHWNLVRVSEPHAERDLRGLYAGDSFVVTTTVYS